MKQPFSSIFTWSKECNCLFLKTSMLWCMLLCVLFEKLSWLIWSSAISWFSNILGSERGRPLLHSLFKHFILFTVLPSVIETKVNLFNLFVWQVCCCVNFLHYYIYYGSNRSRSMTLPIPIGQGQWPNPYKSISRSKTK